MNWPANDTLAQRSSAVGRQVAGFSRCILRGAMVALLIHAAPGESFARIKTSQFIMLLTALVQGARGNFAGSLSMPNGKL
jgi:hypothetical protein